jgi:hypothetical protein
VRQTCPVRGHSIEAFDCPDGHRELVGSRIAHHANALHGQQHREALPQPFVPSRAPHFLGHDGVGLAQQVELPPGQRPQETDGEAWPRKGLANQELFVDSQIPSDGADLVFEQLAKRLDEAESHALGQPTHVVMAFDGGRRSPHRHRFDHVGIERALRQEVEVPQFVCFRLENVDERRTNDFPFLLRIDHVLKARQKQI